MSSLTCGGSNSPLTALSNQQKNSSSNVSKIFEILPNELVVTIFEYLKPPDIIHSFSNLNCRFEKLIHTYKHDVDLRDLSSTFIEQILPLIRDHVVSLKIDQFVFVENDGDLFQQFPSLKELSISKIDRAFSQKLQPFAFNSFKYLTKLEMEAMYDEFTYKTFTLPHNKLIENEFVHHIIDDDCQLEGFCITQSYASSTGTVQQWWSPCNLTRLDIVLQASSRLSFWLCYGCGYDEELDDSDEDNELTYETTALVLPETPFLREFRLKNTEYITDFKKIVSLLKDRTSLETLSLDLRFEGYDIDASNGDRIYKELLQDLINLKSFSFHFTIELSYSRNPDCVKEYVFDAIKTFQTDFWLKDHDWKVGGFGYSGIDHPEYSLFTLPYPYSRFEESVDDLLMESFAATVPLSSNFLDNVKSVTLYPDANLPELKFVENYFKKLNDLAFIIWKRDDVDNDVSAQIQIQLEGLKKLTYDSGDASLLKQLLSMATNLKNLMIDGDKLIKKTNYLRDITPFLQQMKHLKTVTLEFSKTSRAEGEIAEHFKAYLPKITISLKKRETI